MKCGSHLGSELLLVHLYQTTASTHDHYAPPVEYHMQVHIILAFNSGTQPDQGSGRTGAISSTPPNLAMSYP